MSPRSTRLSTKDCGRKSGVQFAAYIPFYPDCSTSYATDTETVARPIRIFHGTPDNYNPVASCKAYLARLQDAKRDAALTEYPDSAHGFDAGLLGVSTVAVSVNAQSARNCRLKEGEGGVLMNDETNSPSPTRTPALRSIHTSAAIRRPRSTLAKP